jgi:hypothetical protein
MRLPEQGGKPVVLTLNKARVRSLKLSINQTVRSGARWGVENRDFIKIV